MKSSSVWTVFAFCIGCASAPPPPVTVPPMPDVAKLAPPAVIATGVSSPAVTTPSEDPLLDGEKPWWNRLASGVYRFEDRRVVLGMGASRNHRHITEGLINARVAARLAVRKASERVAFKGAPPEPHMLDLFVTRSGEFLVLYEVAVPENATTPQALEVLHGPQVLAGMGDHRVGRHYFNGKRHLYLECDVEGPIANPDWGRSRVSARN